MVSLLILFMLFTLLMKEQGNKYIYIRTYINYSLYIIQYNIHSIQSSKPSGWLKKVQILEAGKILCKKFKN